jgi:uncharacterized protein YdeI (YjbR/CyaY-like superfamily)
MKEIQTDFHVTEHKDLPVLRFPSPEAFEDWLSKHHTQKESVWLQFAKKASAHTTITYLEARDEALCWGWIDSVINKFDDDFYLTKFSQRRPKSLWSEVNVGVIAELTKQGRMREPGLREVAAAKSDGRWDRAYAPQSKAVIPDDFAAALAKLPRAQAAFEALKAADKYSYLFKLTNTKSPETRKKKIEEFATMLAREVESPS